MIVGQVVLGYVDMRACSSSAARGTMLGWIGNGEGMAKETKGRERCPHNCCVVQGEW